MTRRTPTITVPADKLPTLDAIDEQMEILTNLAQSMLDEITTARAAIAEARADA